MAIPADWYFARLVMTFTFCPSINHNIGTLERGEILCGSFLAISQLLLARWRSLINTAHFGPRRCWYVRNTFIICREGTSHHRRGCRFVAIDWDLLRLIGMKNNFIKIDFRSDEQRHEIGILPDVGESRSAKNKFTLLEQFWTEVDQKDTYFHPLFFTPTYVKNRRKSQL